MTYPVGTYLFERHKEDGRWAILRTRDEDYLPFNERLDVMVPGTIYGGKKNSPNFEGSTWISHEFSYTQISEAEVLIYKMGSQP
jgi:hypothetical protein